MFILFNFLIVLVVYRMVFKKSIPDNLYTPFDYITSQTTVEFHEEKEEKEEEAEQGDKKSKNKKSLFK